jgi:hypothetical protein
MEKKCKVVLLPYTPSVDAPISMWGWKEPNTHVVLDRLWAELPRLKYVHVRRHGLDMAFSWASAWKSRWPSSSACKS